MFDELMSFPDLFVKSIRIMSDIIIRQRMIKNIDPQQQHSRTYLSFIRMQKLILQAYDEQSYILFTLHIILFISFSISVFFIMEPFQPASVNQFMRKLVGSRLAGELFHVDPLVINGVIMGLLLVFLTLFLVMMIGRYSSLPGFLVLNYYFRFGMMIITLIVELMVTNFLNFFKYIGSATPTQESPAVYVGLLNAIVILLSCTVICIHKFFKIKPIRFRNIRWQFTNQVQFSRFMLNIIRTICLSVCYSDGGVSSHMADKAGLATVLISLFLELEIVRMEKQQFLRHLNPKFKAINSLTHNSIIGVHVSILISMCLGDKFLAFKACVVFVVIAIIICILEFISAFKRALRLPACSSQNKVAMYNFYFEYVNRKKDTDDSFSKIIEYHHTYCQSKDCMLAGQKELDKDMSKNKESLLSSDIPEIKKMLTNYFRKYSHESPEAEILYEVWKSQVNMKKSINSKTRDFNIEQRFLIDYLNSADLQETNSFERKDDTTSNYSTFSINCSGNDLKEKFYRELYLLLEHVSFFNEELNKYRPCLKPIIQSSIMIYQLSRSCEQKFEQMIKQKQLNYPIIQLYVKIMNTLFRGSTFSQFLEKKLNKLKIFNKTDKIWEIDHPCLQIETDSQIIEQFNCQALKFMRKTRYELKDRKIDSIIDPPISIEQLNQYMCKNNNGNDIYIFLKTGENSNNGLQGNLQKVSVKKYDQFHQEQSYLSQKRGNQSQENDIQNTNCHEIALISLERKTLNNKQYYFVTLKKMNYSKNNVEMLVDGKTYELIICNRQSLHLEKILSRNKTQSKEQHKMYGHHSDTEIYIADIYKQFFQQQLLKLNGGQKSLRIKISVLVKGANNRLNLMGNLIEKECPYPHLKLFSVRITPMKPEAQERRTVQQVLKKVYEDTSNYSFNYDIKSDASEALTLQGSQNFGGVIKSITSLLKTRSQNGLLQQKNKLTSLEAIQTIKTLSKDIKTYRLYKEDLYNIDLEDKQAYEKNFNAIQANQQTQLFLEKIPLDYLFIVLFLIVMGILTISIIMTLQHSESVQTISNSFTRYRNIEFFQIDFYRISGILRDVLSGLYQQNNISYQIDLKEVHMLVQESTFTNLFNSSQKYNMQFGGYNFRGNLNELIQIVMTEVFNFMKSPSPDLHVIDQMQDSILKTLLPLINSDRQQLETQISNKSSWTVSYSGTLILVIASLAAVFRLAFLMVCYAFKKNLVKHLRPLLMNSETEIKRVIEETDKLKEYIVALSRNYEVNIEDVGMSKNSNVTRKKPKRIEMGCSAFSFQILMAVGTLIIWVSFNSLHFYTLSSELAKFEGMHHHQKVLSDLYIDLCKQSNRIPHFRYTVSDIDLIYFETKQAMIEKMKGDFLFSQQTTDIFNRAFFEDSCPLLRQYSIVRQNSTCESLNPGFEIENPYQYGLSLYFYRQIYNLASKVEETAACTGIYSRTFRQVIYLLSTRCFKETEHFITEIEHKLRVMDYLLILIGVVESLTVLGSCVYFKRYKKSISNMISCLNIKDQTSKDFGEQNAQSQSISHTDPIPNSSDQETAPLVFNEQKPL